MLGCFVFLKPYLRFVVKSTFALCCWVFLHSCVESKNGGIASLGSEKVLGEHGGAWRGQAELDFF